MTKEEVQELTTLGLSKISKGSVAVLILAGGQGTRLGFEHPKGMFDIGLPSGKSIFQILVERFIKIQMIAGGAKILNDKVQKCKLLIMTSKINHKETEDFLIANKYFGAKKENILLFE